MRLGDTRSNTDRMAMEVCKMHIERAGRALVQNDPDAAVLELVRAKAVFPQIVKWEGWGEALRQVGSAMVDKEIAEHKRSLSGLGYERPPCYCDHYWLIRRGGVCPCCHKEFRGGYRD